MGGLRILALFILAYIINAAAGIKPIDSPRDLYRDRYRKQPNIIYIMADDMGYNDIGFVNPKVKTPNLDALKENGIELTQLYMQPICTPSRSALMTGKYPSNNGLQQLVIQAGSQSCLPLEHHTIFDYMKTSGYRTKYVGKWHLGDCNVTCLPENRGIDEFRGVLTGSVDYYNWTKEDVVRRFVDGEHSTENIGTHLTIQDAKDAGEMIRDCKGSKQPLFMWITPTAPHEPLQTTEEMFNVHSFLDASNDEMRRRREYLGLVSAFDDLVGETMKALKDAHLDQNTIVIFSSDNGGSNIAPSPAMDAEYYANNYPLRNGKFSLAEGGVRVRGLYYDPRLHHRSRGTSRDFLMHVSDWLPTIVQLGSKGRKSKHFSISGIDGVSQVANLGSTYDKAELRKYKNRDRVLIALTDFRFAEFPCAATDAAYRLRDYKLIYGSEYSARDPATVSSEWPKPEESPELPDITGDECYRIENGKKVVRCLFNVVEDPSETKNLYDDKPALVNEILEMINQAKQDSVYPVFTPSLGTSDVTAQLPENGKYLFPRLDFCNPSTQSVLQPNPCF